MIKNLLNRNSIWLGMALGIATPFVSFFVVRYINALALNYFNKIEILSVTAMQLIALCSNLPLFRAYMLKWDKEESGKGMLMATFALAFIYIFLHRQQIL